MEKGVNNGGDVDVKVSKDVQKRPGAVGDKNPRIVPMIM